MLWGNSEIRGKLFKFCGLMICMSVAMVAWEG